MSDSAGMGDSGPQSRGPLARAGYEPVDPDAAAAANAGWWSAEAPGYLAEHGDFLGAADFCWCPEGLRESEAALLGDLEQLRRSEVLEVGAGGAQCSRWLRSHHVRATASDVADGMARASARLDAATGIEVPFVVADARDLPFPDGSFDVVFTAFGAIPFVPDASRVHAEAARVLRRGGRWVCSLTHPIRWAFPDDPTHTGLTAVRSYFDRTPYTERDTDNRPLYAEFHRTIGDHVRDVVGAGLTLVDLVEPQWQPGNTNIWGGWGPERGALLPGTLILVAERQ